MPELVTWKRQKISKLRKDMDRMLERMLGEFRPASCQGIALKKPYYDLVESENGIILKLNIPGIDPDDIEIDITDNILTIKGQIKQDAVCEDGSRHWVQRRYKTFLKSIPIPRRIVLSKVDATYKKGILKIVLPKYSGEEKRGVRVKLG